MLKKDQFALPYPIFLTFLFLYLITPVSFNEKKKNKLKNFLFLALV